MCSRQGVSNGSCGEFGSRSDPLIDRLPRLVLQLTVMLGKWRRTCFGRIVRTILDDRLLGCLLIRLFCPQTPLLRVQYETWDRPAATPDRRHHTTTARQIPRSRATIAVPKASTNLYTAIYHNMLRYLDLRSTYTTRFTADSDTQTIITDTTPIDCDSLRA